MKDNFYKFLKFLNRNKYIVVSFIFVVCFFIFKNNVFAGFMEDIGKKFDEVLGNILLQGSLMLFGLGTFMFNQALPYFIKITSWLLETEAVNDAWILIRDFVNMFFIFFLLFTSFAKLIGKENKLAKGNASKQVVSILLAAFLINFSKVICGVIIDFSQIVMLQFTNSFVGSLGGLTKMFEPDTGTKVTILLGIVLLLFGFLFIYVTLMTLLYFLIRAISLGIFTALSPLWFLFLAFPTKSKSVDQLKSETLGKFTDAAIGGPILAFYLWISLLMISPGSDGSLIDNVDNAGNGGKVSDYANIESENVEAMSEVQSSTSMASILKVIVGAVVLYFANTQAMKMSKKAGNIAGKGIMDGVVNKVSAIGMKPFDVLKNGAKNIGNGAKNIGENIGNFAKAKTGSALDILGGNLKMNTSKFVDKHKILRAGKNFIDNSRKNSEANRSYVNERTVLNKELQKAKSSGSPEEIRKAQSNLNEFQIKRAKSFNGNVRRAGGLGHLLGENIVNSGVVKTGKSIFGKVFNGETEEQQFNQRIKQLDEKKKMMENNKQKYTKDDVAVIDKQIKNERDRKNEEDERKKFAEKEKRFRVAKSARSELDSKKLKQEKSLAKGFVEFGIKNNNQYDAYKSSKQKEINDLNSKISKVKDPEVIAKLKSKADSIQSEINLMDKNKKLLDEQGGFNVKIGEYLGNASRIKELEEQILPNHMTIDDIKKQESAVKESKKNVVKSQNDIIYTKNKADGIVDKKEISNSLKSLKDELSNITSSLIDYTTGELKKDSNINFASMVRAVTGKNGKSKLSIRGSENEFIASIIAKIQNGMEFNEDEKALIEHPDVQSQIGSYIDRADKDFKEEYNKNIKKSDISLPNANVRDDKNDPERSKRIFDIAKGNLDNDSLKYDNSTNYKKGLNVFEELNKNKTNSVKIDDTSIRKLWSGMESLFKRNGNESLKTDNEIRNLIDNNAKLSSDLNNFAKNFSDNSNDFISTALNLVSEIKDKEQRDSAMAVIMEKLIGNIDNLESARSVVSNSLENDQNSEDIFNAYDKAEQNIISKDKAQKEEEENLQDYLDNGFSRS